MFDPNTLVIPLITGVTPNLHLQINKLKVVQESEDNIRVSNKTKKKNNKRRRQFDGSDDNVLQKERSKDTRNELSIKRLKGQRSDNDDLEIRHFSDNSNLSPSLLPPQSTEALIEEGSKNIQAKKIFPRFIGDGSGVLKCFYPKYFI